MNKDRTIAKRTWVYAACAALALLAGDVRADMLINYEQVGEDTVVSYSGSFSTNGYNTINPSFAYEDQSARARILLVLHDDNSLFQFDPDGTTGLMTSETTYVADSYTGDQFGLIINASYTSFYAPANFSGGELSGTITFENLDVLSMGVIQQTIAVGENTITVVPEPASASLLLVAGSAVYALRRIKRFNRP